MSIKSTITQKTLQQLNEFLETPTSLGVFLRAIRQGEELSQVEFAKLLHMTKQQLCDIEHQRKLVSPKLAAKYAKILGYSQAQFIRLALQDMVNRDALPIRVEVELLAQPFLSQSHDFPIRPE